MSLHKFGTGSTKPCYATPNCPGIWTQNQLANGENITSFLCSICNQWNCTICKINHGQLSCTAYNIILNEEYIANLKKTSQAMGCPNCGVTIIKTFGCDKILCQLCKKKFIWYPKGY